MNGGARGYIRIANRKRWSLVTGHEQRLQKLLLDLDLLSFVQNALDDATHQHTQEKSGQEQGNRGHRVIGSVWAIFRASRASFRFQERRRGSRLHGDFTLRSSVGTTTETALFVANTPVEALSMAAANEVGNSSL